MDQFISLCVNTFSAYLGVIPFLIILQFLSRKYGLPKRHQAGLYLYALTICFILTSADSPSLYQLSFDPQFNLIPFLHMADNYPLYIQGFLVYLPFGFLLPALWEQFHTLKKVALYTLIFSLIVELSQIFCLSSTAVTDITDLLLNLAGSLLGYLLFLCIERFSFMNRMCLTCETSLGERLSNQEASLYFAASWLVTFLLAPFIANAIWDIIWNNAVGMPF